MIAFTSVSNREMAAPTGGAATGGATTGGGQATAAALLPGSICVKLGFEQHFGECWNDSLSMFLLFADGYKEITQPLLIDTTSHPALIDAFMKKITPPLPAAEDVALRGMLEEYLQYLSYRFQYHITHIQKFGNSLRKGNRDFRRLSLRCSLKTATGILEILNFLKKHNRLDFLGINAMTSHIIKILSIKTGLERGWIGYEPVGAHVLIKFGAIEILHSLFGFTDKKRVGTVSTAGTVFLISLKLKDTGKDDAEDEDDTEAQAITVFKCNGKWYLYDDNMILLKDFTPVLTGDNDKDYDKMVEQIKHFYEEKGISKTNGYILEVESIDTLETLEASSLIGGKRRRTRRNRRGRRTHKHRK